MSFLVLLLVVLILRFTPWRQGFPFDALGRWARVVQEKSRLSPVWQTLILLALPLLLAGIVLWVLRGHVYGLLTLIAHVALVLVAVGRNDPLGSMALAFEEAWQRGDQEAAYHVARRDLQLDSAGPNDLLRGVDASLARATFRDYVTPVFWYLLLGPLGPLGYRLLDRFEQQQEHFDQEHPALPAVMRISHALEWLPSRLFALSLALVGDFERTLGLLRGWLLRWEVSADRVVSGCVAAALGDEQQAAGATASILHPVRTLLARSLMVWAACIAFFSLFG
ncbi:regulatory signaling modulator protein AmpE [Halopseudomonas sp.]|uniref:regulatory signaling modulator protein AmpE n=1 Tax=Halopseudomonas sp. TaxID=2901191 RepID=UPI00356534CC